MRLVSRSVVIGGAVAAAWALAPTAAWAPHVPQLVVTPAQVRPGDTVTVAGTRGFGFTNPVQIRFGAVDGPALGSFQPDTQPYAAWGPGTISIPAGTSAGAHVLYATQELSPVEKHIRGVPAQATIEVLGTGGRPVLGVPLTEAGPVGEAGLLKEEEVGTGPLVLVGLGVAGLAMFVAGAAALLSRGRAQTATPVGSER